ncbi:acyl-CoA dehydrogenase [Entomospira entomophila]|uniref:Cyclohex-1-ene-1-carbonyl-CoA dehydrogenase n=1 Tax=Entomospira entomophila TaxID=2719988 RepID=A0A968G9P4_9SPIO|nr:acyl-CoA dehydrogenase [Entomospira entomophilus]
MDFNLSETHLLFQQMVRDFAENEVKPIAHEIDEEERFPIETVEKMRQCGFFGINVPKQYGGAGGDQLLYTIAVEELAKVCGTTSIMLSAHTSLGMAPILEFGTEEQKMRYLPRMTTGEWLGGFGLTEAAAGTDAAGQQTVAVFDEAANEWIINGSKLFITNAGQAHIYIIFAMTDKSKGTKGITAFIVEADRKGFSVGPKEKKMGIRGSATAELIMQNVRIPADNLLGKEGMGFKVAMMTLDGGRIGVAAQALGLASGALESTIDYVKGRKQFGRSIAQFQNTQFQLADMHTKVEAARLLLYRASMRKQAKAPYSTDAAMAKLFASEVSMEVTTKAVQLYGGYGYSREYPVERMMRDAKITEIYEGTSEVQRMVISGAILR